MTNCALVVGLRLEREILNAGELRPAALAAAADVPAGHCLALWRALVSGRWMLVERFEGERGIHAIVRANDIVASRRARLAPREREIAALAAFGHANKVIADDLGISLSSVAATLRKALDKLGTGRGMLVSLFAGALFAGALEAKPPFAQPAQFWFERQLYAVLITPRPDESRLGILGAAEAEVARDAFWGRSAREIALRRGTSRKTVEHQIASLLRKLGLSSRAELVRMLARVQSAATSTNGPSTPSR